MKTFDQYINESYDFKYHMASEIMRFLMIAWKDALSLDKNHNFNNIKTKYFALNDFNVKKVKNRNTFSEIDLTSAITYKYTFDFSYSDVASDKLTIIFYITYLDGDRDTVSIRGNVHGVSVEHNEITLDGLAVNFGKVSDLLTICYNETFNKVYHEISHMYFPEDKKEYIGNSEDIKYWMHLSEINSNVRGLMSMAKRSRFGLGGYKDSSFYNALKSFVYDEIRVHLHFDKNNSKLKDIFDTYWNYAKKTYPYLKDPVSNKIPIKFGIN